MCTQHLNLPKSIMESRSYLEEILKSIRRRDISNVGCKNMIQLFKNFSIGGNYALRKERDLILLELLFTCNIYNVNFEDLWITEKGTCAVPFWFFGYSEKSFNQKIKNLQDAKLLEVKEEVGGCSNIPSKELWKEFEAELI